MPNFVARYDHIDGEFIGVITYDFAADDFPAATYHALEHTPEHMKLYMVEQLPEQHTPRKNRWLRR